MICFKSNINSIILRLIVVPVLVSVGNSSAASVDGFVFKITESVPYNVYNDGINKGLFKIEAKVPNTSCSVELSAFSIQPALTNDTLSFVGRVEKLTCLDSIEKRIFSGQGSVTGTFKEDKSAVSEMILSLWF